MDYTEWKEILIYGFEVVFLPWVVLGWKIAIEARKFFDLRGFWCSFSDKQSQKHAEWCGEEEEEQQFGHAYNLILQKKSSPVNLIFLLIFFIYIVEVKLNACAYGMFKKERERERSERVIKSMR